MHVESTCYLTPIDAQKLSNYWTVLEIAFKKLFLQHFRIISIVKIRK